MLAPRAFSRIPRVRQVGNSSQITTTFLFNPTAGPHFQGYHRYHSSFGTRNVKCMMDWNKKRKSGDTTVWRPITTQSSAANRELDLMGEPENVEQYEDAKGIETITSSVAYSTFSSSSSSRVEVGEVGGLVDVATSTSEINSAAETARNSFGGLYGHEISSLSDRKHAVSVEIGASVMRFVKGRDGSAQKRIEADMDVMIRFPSSKNDHSIVIEGYSMEAITKASERIKTVIDEAVKTPALNYSHFISLPLAIHPQLVDKLVKFQCDILEATDSAKVEDEDVTHKHAEAGIDKSIFIKPKTFHLTVLMLKLWNKERMHAAVEVMESISSKVNEVLDNRPVVVRLKGLDLMRGTKSKAHVLYAPVEEIGDKGRLSRACQVITDAYVKAGLVLEKDAGQKLKLHATLMNTSHRKMQDRKAKKKSIPFDAEDIFERFGSEHWGDYHIREAHLSQRFVYDEGGYYRCCASIPLPKE